jgi:hemerythrin
MAFFEWSDDLRIDVPVIDAQHQRLFELAEHLFEAMRNDAGRDVVGQTLRELAAYTKTHYRAEERLIQRRGYRGLEAQLPQHSAFVERVQSLHARFSSGSAHISMEAMHFLRSGLETHIRQRDMVWASECSVA